MKESHGCSIHIGYQVLFGMPVMYVLHLMAEGLFHLVQGMSTC